MYFFKDLRGFLCLAVICGFSGVSYVGPSIIWPTRKDDFAYIKPIVANITAEVAAIYGANSTNWEDNAWLSTTIAFGIIGGIYVWGPMISVVKHVRIQIIVMAALTCTFSGALAASNQHNKPLAAAFSFLTTFPNGILELIPASLVQMDANDADLGTVFGKSFAGTLTA